MMQQDQRDDEFCPNFERDASVDEVDQGAIKSHQTISRLLRCQPRRLPSLSLSLSLFSLTIFVGGVRSDDHYSMTKGINIFEAQFLLRIFPQFLFLDPPVPPDDSKKCFHSG